MRIQHNNYDDSKKTWSRWFTILEMILTITIFFLVMTTVITFYRQIAQTKGEIEARQILTEQSYFILERLQILMKDYTIDYEEYFNRSQVWCDGVDTDYWNVWENGYCDKYTWYGNRNGLDIANADQHQLYHCSSVAGYASSTAPVIFVSTVWYLQGWWWCYEDIYVPYFDNVDGKYQSYGQYSKQFIDTQDDVDFFPWPLGDDDDVDLWVWPEAIRTLSTGVQELYLTSQDNLSRLFLRRALTASGNRNLTWAIGDSHIDTLYAIQMLKLRSFDAWHLHNFDAAWAWSDGVSRGVYDSVIDTWACDYGQWFLCNGDQVSAVYSWYRLPSDGDDGRVSLFGKDITITDRQLQIYPTIDPALAFADSDVQINPYITLWFEAKLYGENWSSRLQLGTLDNAWIRLQTTFSINTFY